MNQLKALFVILFFVAFIVFFVWALNWVFKVLLFLWGAGFAMMI